MYNAFSSTNFDLKLGSNFSIPKTTFDFRAAADFDGARAFRDPNLRNFNLGLENLNFNADYSTAFAAKNVEASTPEPSPPSTLPYIWKYQ